VSPLEWEWGKAQMRIDRVQVSNHSRIRDLSLQFRTHAVIVGANDVGKTSLLRLLNLLLGCTTAQLFQRLSLDDLEAPGTELVVGARLVDFDDEDRRIFHREISISEDDRSESLRVQLTAGRDPADETAVMIRRWFPEGGHSAGPSRDQLARFGWRYLPATRGATATALDGPNSALQTLLRGIDLGEQETELVGLMSTFNNRLDDVSTIDQLRGDVAKHLSRAMPRSVDKDELAVRTSIDPGVDVLGAVSMFFKRDDALVPLSEQSDGLRQLISMTLFDLAEGGANVVAIDEPELHLHPASQRTVADLFAKSTNQKILATHSPYMVQRFEPQHVIAVGPDGNCNQIADEKLNAVAKQLANWWSPRLLEALTSRFVILVEGPSDRVIVEAAAEQLGIHLDRLGAVVVDLDGAHKFPHVYKLIGKDGFNVKLLGLVDEAESAMWHGTIGGRPRDVFGSQLWVSAPDLEAEYCDALGGPNAARALIASTMCSERTILQACNAADIDHVDPAALAHYCRGDGRKVTAAVAIASHLTQSSAVAITSVAGLLAEVARLGA
jgi:putative ATP-dependent endonuclease of OLD family